MRERLKRLPSASRRCAVAPVENSHGLTLMEYLGVHRCMGNRLAEMQLRVLREEIMKRFRHVEVVGEPKRTFSAFVRGYTELPVRVHRFG